MTKRTANVARKRTRLVAIDTPELQALVGDVSADDMMAHQIETVARLSRRAEGAHLRPAVRRAYWALLGDSKLPANRARASAVVAEHVHTIKGRASRKDALERLLWALAEETSEPAFGDVAADPKRLAALLRGIEARGNGGRASIGFDSVTAKCIEAARAFGDMRTAEEIKRRLKSDRQESGVRIQKR